MDAKNVFLHLVKAGRDAFHIEETLKKIGYSDTPYFNLYGEIFEAVYNLLDEDTDSFDESITASAMLGYLPDEMCADELAGIYERTSLSVPDATRSVLEESAANRGITVQQLVNIILSEWALKIELVRSMTI